MFFDIFGNAQIETRIIDQNNHIGAKLRDGVFAVGQVAQYFAQVQHHIDNAHERHIAVVAHHRAALRRHQVAAKKAELRIGIVPFESRHQVRSVQIARSLACYDEVFHVSMKV